MSDPLLEAPLLEVRDLVMQFGGLTAVDHVGFAVEEGRVTGLIGPNGAGKTTVFNMITGFLKPTGGQVLYRPGDREFRGARDLAGRQPHELAALGVARTFQHTSIFPGLTVRENVLTGMHLRLGGGSRERAVGRGTGPDVDEILRLVELEDKAETVASSLPYGDQRRLEIAVALASRPRLLLLDEPAAGMNPEEAARLIGMIRAIRERGVTVVLVEHNMRLVMGVCDYIYVLEHGKKIAEGRPREVANDSRVIEVYLGRKRANG